jgi:predicted CopG family antitoxin
MVANMLDADAEQVAKIIGPLVDINMPGSVGQVLERLIERKQRVLDLLIRSFRTDSSKFTVDKTLLRSVAQEKEMMLQQIQQQQAANEQAQAEAEMQAAMEAEMAAQGGMNGAAAIPAAPIEGAGQPAL